jgi:hypothetical protein
MQLCLEVMDSARIGTLPQISRSDLFVRVVEDNGGDVGVGEQVCICLSGCEGKAHTYSTQNRNRGFCV